MAQPLDELPDLLSVQRMHVVRVDYSDNDDEGKGTSGSRIEPALDGSWPALTRLSWLLGVIYVDSGIEVEAIRYRTNWCLVVDGELSTSGPSAGPTVEREIDELWGQLHSLSRGYQLGRKRAARNALIIDETRRRHG